MLKIKTDSLKIKSEILELRRMSSPNSYACMILKMSKTKKYAMLLELVGIRESISGRMKKRKLLRHLKHCLKTINRAIPPI